VTANEHLAQAAAAATGTATALAIHFARAQDWRTRLHAARVYQARHRVGDMLAGARVQISNRTDDLRT